MRTLINRALFLLLALLCSAEAWGATYYIDPTNTGTANGACATPYTGYASLPALVAGDFILQKAGTTWLGAYAAPTSGNSTFPITYGVYLATAACPLSPNKTSGTATLDGNGAGVPFSMTNKSWVNVSLLNVKGSNGSDVLGEMYCNVCSDVKLESITPLSTGLGNNFTGISVIKSDRVTVNAMSAEGFSHFGLIFYGSTAGLTHTGNVLSNSYIADIAIGGTNAAYAGVRVGCDFSDITWSNLTISGNTITRVGTYPADTAGFGINHTCRMPGEKITNNDISYAGGAGVYNICGAGGNVLNVDMSGSIFSGNKVHHNGRFGFWNAGCNGIINDGNYVYMNGSKTGTCGGAVSCFYGRGFETVDVSSSLDTSTVAASIGAGYNVVGTTGVTFTATGEFAAKGANIIGQTIISADTTNPGVLFVTAQGAPATDQVIGTVLYPFTSNAFLANKYVHAIIPTNVIFRYNRVWGDKNFIGNCSEGSALAFDDKVSVSQIYGNFSFDNLGTALDINSGVGNDVIGNLSVNDGQGCTNPSTGAVGSSTAVKQNGIATRVWYNTLVRNKPTSDGYDSSQAFSLVGVFNCCSLSTADIKGNIITGFKVGVWKSDADTEQSNIFYLNSIDDVRRNDNAARTIDATSKNMNPAFVNLFGDSSNALNFNLAPTSPLIGVGPKLSPGPGMVCQHNLTAPSYGAIERCAGAPR